MTANANLTQAECVARAAVIRNESSLIELDLRGAGDPAVDTFPSTTTLRFAAAADASTWVDLIADEVVRATLNGVALDTGEYHGARLPVHGLAERNELVIEARCRYSRTGEGLHRFTDPEDQHAYLYTHFEPTDARRMFACFEQPDLKAQFTVRVTAPADWVVRSGQPATETIDVGDSDGSPLTTTTFAPTPPLSSYLVALAAGPYHLAEDEWSTRRDDGSTQTIPLTLLCRQAMAPYLETADIFAVTKSGLSFYDTRFGYPYPWGKYDQIFVPEYNLGAMENPGLVTFTESYLPRGRPTEQDREHRAEVIMHEMAHMWFGDLATMRWWDGLWLKESFADLMGYHVCSAATPYRDAWTSFAIERKAWAYRADQLPSTHPVVATIDDLEAARQNFDGITYAKGASVIKQLMAYVGEDVFFAGVATYFARHAFGSTELSDLLAALEQSSGRDLHSWSQRWLETAGLGTLRAEVERGDDGRIARLTIVQEASDPATGAPITRPHRIRIGLYALAGDTLQRTALLDCEVDSDRAEVPDAVGQAADLVLVNDDDLTYAKVVLDGHSLVVASDHLAGLPSPLARGLLWSSLWNATRDALLPAADFLGIVAAQAPRETDAALLRKVLHYAQAAVRTYLPKQRQAAAAERLVALTDAGLRSAPADSDLQTVWARTLAQVAADSPAGVPVSRALLEGSNPVAGLDIDDDLRWALWTAVTAQDDSTTEELARALQTDSSMSGRTACVRAKASRPTEAAKAQAWGRITTGADLTNDELRSLVSGFTAPSGAELIAPYRDRYYAGLNDWWRDRSQTMASIMAAELFPTLPLADGQPPETNPAAVAATAWLTEHPDAPAALRRLIAESLDDLLRALRAQAAAG